MKSYPAKFSSFQRNIIQMRALQKLQDSIKPYNFEACLLNPYKLQHTLGDIWRAAILPFPCSNTYILGKYPQI